MKNCEIMETYEIDAITKYLTMAAMYTAKYMDDAGTEPTLLTDSVNALLASLEILTGDHTFSDTICGQRYEITRGGTFRKIEEA